MAVQRGPPGEGGRLSASGPLTRQLFLGLLGIVYLAAFASFGVQAEGLIGSQGILPAVDLLGAASAELGSERYWQIPSLLWLVGASDTALRGLWVAGVLLSLLPALGIAPRAVLGLLFALYLSLVSVGSVFFNYQWDALLLETGLLALFYAPPGWLPRRTLAAPASQLGLWLLRFLLFRLMLLSGLVKWLSGDPTWRDGSALALHYWTQPIPNAISYYAHQLPATIQAISTFATLAIEVAGPFLIFAPRPFRLAGFAMLAGLQIAIGATGNYGFFNLLTLALCVTLLDDALLRRLTPAAWRARLEAWPAVSEQKSPTRLARAPALVAAGLLVLLASDAALRRLGLPSSQWLGSTLQVAAPLRAINSYGLFAVMTTTRPEILLEGSDDGRKWRPYAFHWKPGALDRAPGFALLHMPRLDWQLWFAALRGCERAAWFHRFLAATLEGREPVAEMLRVNPFPDQPPRYLRSSTYAYEFTGRHDDRWWRRSFSSAYCATVTLRGGRLARASLPPSPHSE